MVSLLSRCAPDTAAWAGLRGAGVTTEGDDAGTGCVVAVLQLNVGVRPDVGLFLVFSPILAIGRGVTQWLNVTHHRSQVQQSMRVFDEPYHRIEESYDTPYCSNQVVGARQVSDSHCLGHAVLRARWACPYDVEITWPKHVLLIAPVCHVRQNAWRMPGVEIKGDNLCPWP